MNAEAGPAEVDIGALLSEYKAIRKLEGEAETFPAFVRRVAPSYWPVPPRLRRLYQLIQDTRRRRVFATISMPPRHGKTTTFRLAYAWRLTAGRRGSFGSWPSARSSSRPTRSTTA